MTFRVLSGRGLALELCLTPDEKKLLIAMEEKDGSTYLDEIVLQTDTLNEQVLALDPNPKGDPDFRTAFNWIIAPHWQHLALPRIIPPTYDLLWYFKTHGGLTPPGPPQPWTAPTPQETDFGIALWLKALAFQMADAEARKEILKTADAVLSRDLKEKKTKGRKR